MSQRPNFAIAVIAIDIGKSSFHLVGHDKRGEIVLRQKFLKTGAVCECAPTNFTPSGGTLLFSQVRQAATAMYKRPRAPRQPRPLCMC